MSISPSADREGNSTVTIERGSGVRRGRNLHRRETYEISRSLAKSPYLSSPFRLPSTSRGRSATCGPGQLGRRILPQTKSSPAAVATSAEPQQGGGYQYCPYRDSYSVGGGGFFRDDAATVRSRTRSRSLRRNDEYRAMARTLLLPHEITDMYQEFRENELSTKKAARDRKGRARNSLASTGGRSNMIGDEEIVESDEESTVASNCALSIDDEDVFAKCKDNKGTDILTTEVIVHETNDDKVGPGYDADGEPTLVLPSSSTQRGSQEKDCRPSITQSRTKSSESEATKKKGTKTKKTGSSRKTESNIQV